MKKRGKGRPATKKLSRNKFAGGRWGEETLPSFHRRIQIDAPTFNEEKEEGREKREKREGRRAKENASLKPTLAFISPLERRASLDAQRKVSPLSTGGWTKTTNQLQWRSSVYSGGYISFFCAFL